MENQSINQAGQAVGKPRVGTMLVCYPLQGGDPLEQFVSLGTKAILSWVPNSTGKGFAKRAGGPGLPPTNKSNWVLLLDSMIQCGLPADTLKGNDFTAIDGIWMHIKPMPEPEERKSFRKQAATGEAQEDDEPRGNGLVPICTEILEGGKPWEGGGGFTAMAAPPAAQPARPAAAPNRRTAAAPATAPAPVAAPRRPAAPAPPPVEDSGDEETLEQAAMLCVADVLQMPQYHQSIKRMELRMKTHGVATQKYDEATASAIITDYFSNETALGNLLGGLGYKLSGAGPQQSVIPA
jgi:hypothetical protein